MKIDQNFNLVAFCLNHGSKEEKYIEVKVSQISGWRGKDSYKEGTKLALEELFDKSHKPQHKVLVYNSDFVEIHSHLSCSDQTPLYTNVEMEVSKLELNTILKTKYLHSEQMQNDAIEFLCYNNLYRR